LDEFGYAMIVCDCGAGFRVPYETVEPEQRKTRRAQSWKAVALWLVILGLIVLLLPAIRIEPTPAPPPPDYLTT
jgi:hypothetical protein